MVFSDAPRHEGMWEMEAEVHEFVTAGIDSGSGQIHVPAALAPSHKDKRVMHSYIGTVNWQACYYKNTCSQKQDCVLSSHMSAV